MITGNFNLQKSTGMVLLDVKAAFDTIWHERLIYKMIMYDFPIHTYILNWPLQPYSQDYRPSFSHHLCCVY